MRLFNTTHARAPKAWEPSDDQHIPFFWRCVFAITAVQNATEDGILLEEMASASSALPEYEASVSFISIRIDTSKFQAMLFDRQEEIVTNPKNVTVSQANPR